MNDSPQNVGDVMVVVAEEDATGHSLTSLSGGGVTTWNKAGEHTGAGEPRVMDIWYGTVTATGASTINFTWSPAITTNNAEYEVQEFSSTAGANTTWSLDTFNHAETTPASTNVDYPTLTPATSNELYVGFADMPSGPPTGGSDPGFTYNATVDGNMVVYNPGVSATVSPVSHQPVAHLSSSVGALLSAASPLAPTVTSVSPTGGARAGGDTVTVTGTNLTGATAVDFGANAGSSIVVNGGGTSLTVTSPAGSGAVHVTVTTPNGTSNPSAADIFTYAGTPTITSISPSSGSGSGGSTVTITGTNLTGATSVAFGANHGTNISVNNAGTSLTVTAPAGNAGTVDVSVTTPGGTTGTVQFTYVAYWMVGSDGGVFSFGGAPFFGSLPALGAHVSNVVAIVPTHDGEGYWMIGRDGGVFAFGDAGFVGSIPGLHAHVNNIVGAVPTASGKGYWMVGSDGGVFAFGDATFVGSIPGLHAVVNDVVGVVATPDNLGYWMVGSDGGVFAFGDATFVGSIPGLHVTVHNVVGFAPQT